MALRFAGDNFSALALPPFLPPMRPRATACGFLPASGSSNGVPSICTSNRRTGDWRAYRWHTVRRPRCWQESARGSSRTHGWQERRQGKGREIVSGEAQSHCEKCCAKTLGKRLILVFVVLFVLIRVRFVSSRMSHFLDVRVEVEIERI